MQNILKRDKLDESDIYEAYPSIIEYVNAMGDEKKRQVVLEKFNGNTLQEVGDKYGVTRERVRQIYTKILHQACYNGPLREDKYRYFFLDIAFQEKILP